RGLRRALRGRWRADRGHVRDHHPHRLGAASGPAGAVAARLGEDAAGGRAWDARSERRRERELTSPSGRGRGPRCIASWEGEGLRRRPWRARYGPRLGCWLLKIDREGVTPHPPIA